MAMSQITPAPEANISLAKGSAILAIVYHSILVATALVTTVALSGITAMMSYSGTGGLEGEGTRATRELMLIAMMTLIGTLSLLTLSIWMLVSVRRYRLWHVCTALIVFSGLAALPLIIAAIGLAPSALFSFSLYLLPEILVALLGWFGWFRMRRPPEVPAVGQFPYQVGQFPYQLPPPGPYTAPSPAVRAHALPSAPAEFIALVRAEHALARWTAGPVAWRP